MTRRDPARRPTAANVLQQWKALRRNVWSVQRFWRPRPRGEALVNKALYDAFSLVGFFLCQSVSGVLTPDP